MKLAILVALFGIAALPSPAAAQPATADPSKRGIPLTDFPRVVRLAANVYGYEEIRQPGFTTVSLFVVGRDGILVADGQGSVQATSRMLEEIAKVSALPVRWYVVGSDHGDHTAGNSTLPADVRWIVHRTSREQLVRDSMAAAGAARAAGQPLRVVRVPPPNSVVAADRQVVDVGGLEVEVMFLGRGHTGGDLMVHVPSARLLFMSEAFLNRVFPAMRSAYPSEWVALIDRALALDVDRFVPGHGFIEEAARSRDELRAFREAMVAVIDEVARLHRLGLSVDEAVTRANWGPYADWFLAAQQAPIAVRRVYDQIDGRLPK
ncbi:MAG: MBL fold metallo-hydrolase [Gemmatimonadota bacterium]